MVEAAVALRTRIAMVVNFVGAEMCRRFVRGIKHGTIRCCRYALAPVDEQLHRLTILGFSGCVANFKNHDPLSTRRWNGRLRNAATRAKAACETESVLRSPLCLKSFKVCWDAHHITATTRRRLARSGDGRLVDGRRQCWVSLLENHVPCAAGSVLFTREMQNARRKTSFHA